MNMQSTKSSHLPVLVVAELRVVDPHVCCCWSTQDPAVRDGVVREVAVEACDVGVGCDLQWDSLLIYPLHVYRLELVGMLMFEVELREGDCRLLKDAWPTVVVSEHWSLMHITNKLDGVAQAIVMHEGLLLLA